MPVTKCWTVQFAPRRHKAEEASDLQDKQEPDVGSLHRRDRLLRRGYLSSGCSTDVTSPLAGSSLFQTQTPAALIAFREPSTGRQGMPAVPSKAWHHLDSFHFKPSATSTFPRAVISVVNRQSDSLESRCRIACHRVRPDLFQHGVYPGSGQAANRPRPLETHNLNKRDQEGLVRRDSPDKTPFELFLNHLVSRPRPGMDTGRVLKLPFSQPRTCESLSRPNTPARLSAICAPPLPQWRPPSPPSRSPASDAQRGRGLRPRSCKGACTDYMGWERGGLGALGSLSGLLSGPVLLWSCWVIWASAEYPCSSHTGNYSTAAWYLPWRDKRHEGKFTRYDLPETS